MPPKQEKPSDKLFSIADAVSLSRPLLAALANRFDVDSRLYKSYMLASFASDALDGHIAKHDGESRYGDLIDIFSDHITETIMYKKLIAEGVVPPAVLAVTATRSVLVDAIRLSRRMYGGEESREDPFSVGESRLGQAVTSSRLSRLGYGLIKASIPQLAGQYPKSARAVSVGATTLSVVRALPVVLSHHPAEGSATSGVVIN